MLMKAILISLLAIGAVLAGSALFTQWHSSRIARAWPPRGEFAQVDGARIHFTQLKPAGESVGTVALVHGASGNEADMRLAIGEKLAARGYRVLSIDRPGHGWSERDGLASTPAVQARQIRQTLEKAGVKRAIVAGHSLAGALTLQLALDHGDLVEGVVLIAPVTHPWPGGGIAAYYRLTAAPVIGPLFARTLMMPAALAVFDRGITGVFRPDFPPANYRERTGVELVLQPENFRANALDVASMYEFVTLEHTRYGRISMPVSIITGDRDDIVLTHIHSLGSARDIPGAQLHVMKHVGHSPHWARPDETAALIADFAAAARQRTGPEAAR